jgi:hypothetical protein
MNRSNLLIRMSRRFLGSCCAKEHFGVIQAHNRALVGTGSGGGGSSSTVAPRVRLHSTSKQVRSNTALACSLSWATDARHLRMSRVVVFTDQALCGSCPFSPRRSNRCKVRVSLLLSMTRLQLSPRTSRLRPPPRFSATRSSASSATVWCPLAAVVSWTRSRLPI